MIMVILGVFGNMCHHKKNKREGMRECDNCMNRSFKNRIKTRYNLTVEEYDAMVEAQGGVCAICGGVETHPSRKRLSIDHDHKTGKVRGILCYSCNTGLGKFRDSARRLEAAAEYVRNGGV